jgi:hypothetical protein
MKIVFNPFTGNFDWINDGTITGSGVATRVAFWSSASNISSDADLYWDNTNKRLGVGIASPLAKLHVNGNTQMNDNLTIGHGSGAEYNIQIGQQRTGNGFAYVDLIGDATYTDYGFRMIRQNGGANTSSEILHRGTGNFNIQTLEAASLSFFTTSAARMSILAGGNVGVGTTNPAEKFVVSDSGAAGFEYIPSSGRWYRFNRSTLAYGGLYAEASEHTWSIGATEKMRLSASGFLGVNNNNPGYVLDVTGDSRILSGSLGVGVAPNATDGRIDASNDIVAFSSSDSRLKTNVSSILSALNKVLSLNGVEFDWDEKLSHLHGYEGHDVGIIAQEVQSVLPEAVRVSGHGYLSVRYEKLVPLLIEAIKEQQILIDAIMSKLEE